MSHFGRLEEFDCSSTDINSYFEGLHAFYSANNVRDSAKVDVFLSVVGPKKYKLLKSLIAPTLPSDKTTDELYQTLKRHVQPTDSVISRRVRFYTRKQKDRKCHRLHSGAETVSSRMWIWCFSWPIVVWHFCYWNRRQRNTEKAERSEAIDFRQGGRDCSHARISFTGIKRYFRQRSNRWHACIRSLQQWTGAAATASAQQARAGWWLLWGQLARSAAEQRKHRCLQVLSLRPEPSCVDMQVQAVRMSRMPQKGSSQVSVPQQSQVPWCANVRGRGRRGRAFRLFHTSTPVKASKEPWSTTMVIDQVPVWVEIDTGSGKSVIGKDIWKQSSPKKKLRETPVNLMTYSGKKLPLLGICLVEVQHQGERHRLELLVADVKDQLPTIGRDWLSKIKIDWKGVFHIKSRTLQQVLDKHEAVFEKGLGTMKKFKAKLHLKSGATPKFVKARPVPFALRPKVEVSLEKLEQEGVLKKVTHNEWGSPIVVVPKKTGGMRICGDYKVTLNQVLDVDQHPLPKPSNLFATLAGGKVFSKLDLTQAYHQMEVGEKFQHLLTITTLKGLCRYHRLPFGISSAPALFQQTMEQILQGIPGVVAFMDDIELTGATAEEHLDRLDQVLQRLQEHGLRLQKSKCEFLKDRVEYLGHIIDKDGLLPVLEKVRAITDSSIKRQWA